MPNKPYYYILLDPDKKDRCKVGITKNPKQRLSSYRTANPDCYYDVVYMIPDSNHHEKEILSLLKDVCIVKSEYIHGVVSVVRNIIEGYFDDCKLDWCVVKSPY